MYKHDLRYLAFSLLLLSYSPSGRSNNFYFQQYSGSVRLMPSASAPFPVFSPSVFPYLSADYKEACTRCRQSAKDTQWNVPPTEAFALFLFLLFRFALRLILYGFRLRLHYHGLGKRYDSLSHGAGTQKIFQYRAGYLRPSVRIQQKQRLQI